MIKKRAICLIAITIFVMCLLAACGGEPEKISGKYTTNNPGLTFSGFEFSDDGEVTYYCAGYENSHGTYEADGSDYILKIDDVDQNSNYVGFVEAIKEKCDIIATPVDENTIDIEIKAKDSDEIYAGQLGKETYTKEQSEE